MDRTAYLAFCEGAQICPTDCDDTCPDDDNCATLCHELGKPDNERSHQPADCPTSRRADPR